MKTLARWISNRSVAWAVVSVVALLSLVSLYRVGNLGHDDDVELLPQHLGPKTLLACAAGFYVDFLVRHPDLYPVYRSLDGNFHRADGS